MKKESYRNNRYVSHCENSKHVTEHVKEIRYKEIGIIFPIYA